MRMQTPQPWDSLAQDSVARLRRGAEHADGKVVAAASMQAFDDDRVSRCPDPAPLTLGSRELSPRTSKLTSH